MPLEDWLWVVQALKQRFGEDLIDVHEVREIGGESFSVRFKLSKTRTHVFLLRLDVKGYDGQLLGLAHQDDPQSALDALMDDMAEVIEGKYGVAV